ncbi:MAG: 2-keto-4-pentenoate hydratase [Candidatus Microbacterium stercoravium]|uniref:2-keto-4-pentenoate hydratase n=1 Tax=Microbacterium sp. TaxID=51671 RepID=UPI003F98E08D
MAFDQIVDRLLAAETDRTDVVSFAEEFPHFTPEDAYRAQHALIERKVAGGERIIGVKLGLTSRAKQQRMGISSPLTAVVTDAMHLDPGVPIPYDRLIHPRVEPEIVFVLGSDLTGPGVTPETALRAVASVHAGLEVIDSRYRDFKFSLADVIADNASSSYFAVGGTAVGVAGLDLANEACVLRVNGQVVDSATGAAVQGHPAAALSLAANALGARGISIPAGSIVLTGGLTDAVPIAPGDSVTVEFTTLGSVTVSVHGGDA